MLRVSTMAVVLMGGIGIQQRIYQNPHGIDTATLTVPRCLGVIFTPHSSKKHVT